MTLMPMLVFGANTVFVKALGGSDYEESWGLIRTQDGGYVMTGYTLSFGTMTMHDVILTKVDSSGNLLWTKTLGGNGSYDIANRVIQATDGGFVIVGATNSFSLGSVDVLIAKFDSSGNYLWTRTFGGSGTDQGSSIVQTEDGGYMVTGFTKSYSAGGDSDVFLAKCDGSGNLIWMKTLGGNKEDAGRQIIRTKDGAYMILGVTQSFSTGGDNDVFLAKCDISGNLLWMKTFGGANEDRASTILQAQDEGYVVVGWTNSFNLVNKEIFISKLDSSGNFLWMRAIGMGSDDWGGYVVETKDGGYAVAGQTNSPRGYPYTYFLLSRFDSLGNHLWTSTLGNPSWACWVKSFTYCSDGGFLMGGETQGWGAGKSDIPLVKFNAQGNNCLASFVTPSITNLKPSVASQIPVMTSVSPTAKSPKPTITSPTLKVTTGCQSEDVFPTVTDVTPNSVLNTVSSTLTIKGSHFKAGAGVSSIKIKGPAEISLTGWTVESDTEIQKAVLASQAKAGIYNVIVTTSVGENPISTAKLTISTVIDTIQKVYIGCYQRPADPGGLIYWANRLDGSGGNLTEITEAFTSSAESQALYGTINSSNISTVVNDIYQALFGRDADIEGLDWYVDGFNSGRYTLATIILKILFGAQNEDLKSVNNKLAAANLFTRTIDPELNGINFQVTYVGEGDAIAGRNFLASVTWDPATVPTQDDTTLYMQNHIADPGDPNPQ